MRKGFTLIELLIVIAIIAILAGVVFVALDPLSRFQDARDSTRWSDVSAILDAVKVHQVDNGGSYLSSVGALTADEYSMIGTCANGALGECTGQAVIDTCVDLTGLVTAGRLGSIPTDPSSGTAAQTDYYLSRSSTGVITVGACEPEGGAAISVSR